MQTMQQCVVAFQEYPKFLRLSVSSRRRQLIVLNYLSEKTGPTKRIDGLTRYHVDSVLADGYRRGLTKGTLNAYRTDLRRYCEFLAIRNILASNVASHLENDKSRTPPSKRKPINADQAAQLQALAAKAHPRDGMTMMLLLSTGLRESEVIGLTWGKADFTKREFETYRPKQDDFVPTHWSVQLTDAIERWKAIYEEKHGPVQNDWFVVPALMHRREFPGFHRMNPEWPMNPTMRQWNVAKRVKSLLAAVGETDLKGRASHTLRRTAGNLLWDQGVEPRVVQTFYNHSSLAMTELYLSKDAAQDKLREALQNFRI